MINARQKIQALFLNDYGEPYTLTDGQLDIFNAVYDPEDLRVAIKAVTQYGKSEVTALALIMVALTRRERILIVSPSGKQSGIIMNYVIMHLFDNEITKRAIEFEGSLEKLKKERSKRRITFTNGSEIFILTADARTVSQEAKALMGFGASVVIVDESALIPDTMFSKILRMVGGVRRGKIVQLGNPFESGHFQRAFKDKRYKTITIKWPQAVREGRIKKEFVEEARESMPLRDFTVFYDCAFPQAGAENSIIPSDWVDLAVNQSGVGGGTKQAGLDVARFGGDSTVYILRDGGVVKRMAEVQKRSNMEVVGWVRGFLDKDKPETMCIDTVGTGSGVFDRLLELDYDVEDINVGSKPKGHEKGQYYNLKAELWFELREWFKPVAGKSNISIPNDPNLIQELKETRYSYDSSRKRRVEAKEVFKKRVGRSPDKADALVLAFTPLTSMGAKMMMV